LHYSFEVWAENKFDHVITLSKRKQDLQEIYVVDFSLSFFLSCQCS